MQEALQESNEKMHCDNISTSHCMNMTVFGRITGGGAGRSKPAIKVNKFLGYLLINGLVRTQTLGVDWNGVD